MKKRLDHDLNLGFPATPQSLKILRNQLLKFFKASRPSKKQIAARDFSFHGAVRY